MQSTGTVLLLKNKNSKSKKKLGDSNGKEKRKIKERENKEKKEEEKEEIAEEEITEEEIQNESIRWGDVLVDFIELIKSPIVKLILRQFLFLILSGYFYKIWLWFSACVLHWYNSPCKEEHGLFTMPFVFASSFSDHQWTSPHFFSFWETGHLALSIFLFSKFHIFLFLFKKFLGVFKIMFEAVRQKWFNFVRQLKLKSVERKRNLKKSYDLRKEYD